MNNYAAEIIRIGGDAMLQIAQKEFPTQFHIIARTAEYVVIGDDNKNVMISRKNNRVQERNILNKSSSLGRKG